MNCKCLLIFCLTAILRRVVHMQDEKLPKKLEVNPKAHAILRGDQKKYHAFSYPGIPECKDPSNVDDDGPGLSDPTSLKLYRFDPSFDPAYAVQATVFEEKTSCYLNFFGLSTLEEIWEVPASFKDTVVKEWREDIVQNAKELIKSGVLGQVVVNDQGVGKYDCCWLKTCYRTRYTVRMKLMRVNWGSSGHIVSPFYNKNCKVNRGPGVSNCSVTKSTNLFWNPLKLKPFSCRLKEITNAPGVVRGFKNKDGVSSISFTSADFRVMFGLQAGKLKDMSPICLNGKNELVFCTEAGVLYTFAPHQGHAIVGYWHNPKNPKEWTDLMMSRLKNSSSFMRDGDDQLEQARRKRSAPKRNLNLKGKPNNSTKSVKSRPRNSGLPAGDLKYPEEVVSGSYTPKNPVDFHKVPVDPPFLEEGHPSPPELIFTEPPHELREKRSAIDNLPLDVEMHALTERVSWTQAQLLYQLNLLANKTTQQLEYSLYQSCINRRLLLHMAEALIPFNERPLVYHYLRHEGFLSSVREGKIFINVGVPIAKIYLGEKPRFCNDKLVISFESPNLGIRKGLMVNRKGLVIEENSALDGKTDCHKQLEPNHFYIPLINGDVYDVVTAKTLSSPLMNTSVIGLQNWEVNSFPIYELKDMNFVNKIADDGMREFLPDHQGNIARDSIWRTLEDEMKLPNFFRIYWHWILSSAVTVILGLLLVVICISCCTKVVKESFRFGFR